jgi:N-acetylglutamate synthase/N-acetylornithine aminotransferase
LAILSLKHCIGRGCPITPVENGNTCSVSISNDAKNHLNNHVRALVINSGNANAGTGVAGSNKGLDNAYQVCEMVAQSIATVFPLTLNCFETVFSTKSVVRIACAT